MSDDGADAGKAGGHGQFESRRKSHPGLAQQRHELNRLKATLAALNDLYCNNPPRLVRTAFVALKGHIAWIERKQIKGL
jgi:hypothetical protein